MLFKSLKSLMFILKLKKLLFYGFSFFLCYIFELENIFLEYYNKIHSDIFFNIFLNDYEAKVSMMSTYDDELIIIFRCDSDCHMRCTKRKNNYVVDIDKLNIE